MYIYSSSWMYLYLLQCFHSNQKCPTAILAVPHGSSCGGGCYVLVMPPTHV